MLNKSYLGLASRPAEGQNYQTLRCKHLAIELTLLWSHKLNVSRISAVTDPILMKL